VRSLLAVLLAACSFSPAALPAGGGPDAPIADQADGPLVVDAPAPDRPPLVDAPRSDAAPPDAEADPCPSPSIALTNGTPVVGMLSGASAYTPTCRAAGTTGAEAFYHIDVANANGADLVIDVVDLEPTLDTILDVTGACVGSPGSGQCSDVGAPGAGESEVVRSVGTTRSYIAVDSVAGTSGRFSVAAFLRAVVGDGAVCSPELTSSRCNLGQHCVDLDDDGVAKCENLEPLSDVGNNDDPCAANIYDVKADAAYLGSFDTAADVDVIKLEPSASGMLRVVLDDGFGGCGVDAALDLLGGNDCKHTAVIATDENSGLGPCPLFRGVPVVGGETYWLRVRAGTGAAGKIKNGAMYTLVIDFLYGR
jgi:hypothetical protein